MKEVTIYTDGACSGNPGPGGWAAVLLYKDKRLEISGFEGHTTNNRMELMAAIRALHALREPCRVYLHSDSTYLINAFEKNWLESWQKKNWLTSAKKPVENKDLWLELLAHNDRHEIHWVKVKGHSSNAENNRCDEIARGEIKRHAENY